MNVATLLSDTAKGAFEVKLDPAGSDPVDRMSIAKTFTGDLTGTSRGEMLAVRTAVKGSAGYVAMEKVTGSLAGRSGSFALQHAGTMSGGNQQLSITVVPDSGTGGLTGLTGQMVIVIAGGQHSYEFSYSLPASGK